MTRERQISLLQILPHGQYSIWQFLLAESLIITIALSFPFGFGSFMLFNCFLNLIFVSLFQSASLCNFPKQHENTLICFNILKYLKSAMITSYRLLLECVLERKSRTMKEIFNLIYNAKVSILRAICTLERLLFSELSSTF